MSKAVLISIKPEWCAKIASGRKTMEVRKTRPKLQTPFKAYIYCTTNELLTKSYHNGKIYVASNKLCKERLEKNGNLTLSGKIIGEFVCDYIMRQCQMQNADLAEQQSLVKRERIFEYANGGEVYGWHISELKIYNTPKKLSEFTPSCDYGDGEECVRPRECECYFQRADCNQDGSVNIVQCARRVTRPPQSWCYVEV